MAEIDREKVIKGLEEARLHFVRVQATQREAGRYVSASFKANENACSNAIAMLKKQESTLNRLRSTMEDMVRGNTSEEVSYLLRLLDKWE